MVSSAKMLFLLFSLPFSLGAIIIPQATGPFKVAITNSQLVDKGRSDPWGYDQIPNRRVMISRFDPIATKSCVENHQLSYMTPGVAAEEDRILGPYEWPVGILAQMKLEFCLPKKIKVSKDTPIVLFSPGMNTTRFYYSVIAREIASRGYSVITIDHPFETDIVEFPDGTVAYGGHFSSRNLTFVDKALKVRTDDISFVIDSIGLTNRKKDKVVMFGHSFGGAASAEAMRLDPRIRGGVNFDGLLYGEVSRTGFGEMKGIEQSFVLWGAQGHNSTEDPAWTSFWNALGEEKVWKKELSLVGGSHGAFWDLNLIADIANVRGQFGQYTEEDLISKLSGARVYQIMTEYLDDFFQFVLRGAKEGLLKGRDANFPEVDFL